MTIDELYDVVEESYVNDEITYEDAMEIMEIAKGNDEKVSMKDKLYNKKLEDLKDSYKAKEITKDEYNKAVDKLDKWYLGETGYNDREEKKAKLKNIAKKVAIGAGVAAAAGVAGGGYYKHANDINKREIENARKSAEYATRAGEKGNMTSGDVYNQVQSAWGEYNKAASRNAVGKLTNAAKHDVNKLRSRFAKKPVSESYVTDYLNEIEMDLFESIGDTVDNEFVMNCLEYSMDFDSNADVFIEGHNIDLAKESRENVKQIKELLKLAKSQIKRKEFDDAKKTLNKTNEVIDKCVKSFDNYPEGTALQAVCGVILNEFLSSCKIFVATLVTLPLMGIGGIIVALKEVINDSSAYFDKLIKTCKDKDSEFTVDMFNTFKTHMKGKYKELKTITKQLIIKVDKLEREEKNKEDSNSADDDIKESMADIFEHERIALYEACQEGKITIDQREYLIDKLNKCGMLEESVISNDIDNYSDKDKYSIIKKDIYERCARGEFDVNTREELLNEAYNRFC